MLRVAVQKRRGSFELDARFEMPTPGVVALFGRSGCGKSTLVEIIAGLLEADSGLVQLDDEVLLDTRRRLDVPPERVLLKGRLQPCRRSAVASAMCSRMRGSFRI